MSDIFVVGAGSGRVRWFTAAACVLAWSVGAAAPAPASAPAPEPPTAQAVPRIIALSPHITELLFSAGAGAEIVGIDDSSDYPPAALTIARVGEAGALDMERLLSLRPTLIIAWQSGTPPRTRTELNRLGVPVVLTEQQRLDDIGAALEEFGRLAGKSTAADAAAAQYRRELAALRERYAGRAPLTVFYQVWDRPLYTLSGRQVVSEVLSLCGGVNVFAELSALAPVVDRESVLQRNPAVILIGARGREGQRQAAEWSRFSRLAAVERRHVYTVDPSLLGRMSTRILEGVTEVCKVLDQARSTSRLQ